MCLPKNYYYTLLTVSIWFSGLMLLLSSCASAGYHIDTRTNRDEVGNYLIKWEVRPGMEGRVEIYASQSSKGFPDNPVMVESIDKQVATYITGDNVSRHFFMLVFDGKASVVTGMRYAPTDALINLRDFGGYPTLDYGTVHWEHLYRSGELTNLSYRDSAVIVRCRFSSGIILSDRIETKKHHSVFHDIPTRVIPANKEVDYNQQLEEILKGQKEDEDIRKFYEEMYEDFIEDNKQQFHEALMHLLDPDNYPVLVTDRYGKDRVGFFVMLVQSILNVSRRDILDDYTLSNSRIQIEQMVPMGYTYPLHVQEALTEFFKCRESDMNRIITLIEQRYGSVQEYIATELDFDLARQDELRKLLLRP